MVRRRGLLRRGREDPSHSAWSLVAPPREPRQFRVRVGSRAPARAEQPGIDPVKLRILNEPKLDEGLGIPFSSRHLLECFEVGAQKFGWSSRTPVVGSMKRDGVTLDSGMAGCTWMAARFPAEATVDLRDDGTARVACATQDIGTGTYTNLAQLASDRTGVPLGKIEVALGDTLLPPGPLSGGSMATASVVPAVFAAATAPPHPCWTSRP